MSVDGENFLTTYLFLKMKDGSFMTLDDFISAGYPFSDLAEELKEFEK